MQFVAVEGAEAERAPVNRKVGSRFLTSGTQLLAS